MILVVLERFILCKLPVFIKIITIVKQTLIILMGLALTVQVATAQRLENVYQYFDRDWEPVSDSTDATYYRVVNPLRKGYEVKDYFMTGELQMEALCSAISPELAQDGPAVTYYRNGNKESEGAYKNNARVGKFYEYYENGYRKSEVIYKVQKTTHVQHWRADGLPLLTDGNGIISNDSEKFTSYEEIVNSETIRSFSIAHGTMDTVYLMADVMPEYPGGYARMMSDLVPNLSYPKAARRARIQGTTYITFIIDKGGLITDAEIIRGFFEECDLQALEAVRKLGRWQPAKANGKPVKCRFNLPVRFKID